ncbi:MAG: hypothetical protein K8L99_20875 [Anaerolineae bacterium]|nr:hypothetical protein [Anaerolineae bacterium]
MHKIRLALMVALLVVMIGAFLIVLNITHPNPTGRRYSSEVIDLTLPSHQKGLQAEAILEKDLHTARNDSSGNRQCICTDADDPPIPLACTSCLAYIPELQNNRRPDFMTDRYIAEVKNHGEGLYESQRDLDELADYVIAAQTLRLPLWVYLRTNIPVPDDFRVLIEATGGGVVSYLAVPDYVDTVGQIALVVLVVSSGLFTLLAAIGIRSQRVMVIAAPPSRPAPTEPIDDLEAFIQRSREKTQRRIDEADSRLGQ